MSRDLLHVDVIGNNLTNGDLALEALADSLADEIAALYKVEYDKMYKAFSRAIPDMQGLITNIPIRKKNDVESWCPITEIRNLIMHLPFPIVVVPLQHHDPTLIIPQLHQPDFEPIAPFYKFEAHARQVLPFLNAKLEEIANHCQGNTMKGAELKPLQRAIEKCAQFYEVPHSQNEPLVSNRLLDMARGKIVFADLNHLLLGLKYVLNDDETSVLRVKNRLDPRFDSADTGGYRDLLFNVQLGPMTHVCEIQFHLSQSNNYWDSIKDQVQRLNMTGYDHYIEFRRLKGRSKAASFK